MSPCYFPGRIYRETAWKVKCNVSLFINEWGEGWSNITELVATFRMDRLSKLDRKVAVLPNIGTVPRWKA